MAAGKEYTPDEAEAMLLRKAMALRSMDYVKTAYPLICKLLESQTKKAFHNQARRAAIREHLIRHQSWPPKPIE